MLPGFIDAHVHIAFYPAHAVLAGGVTTARDLGWPPHAIFPLVRESQNPSFDGPTLHAAGAMLTAPGGYPMRAGWAPAGTGIEVEGIEAAGPAVESQVRRGAAVIKVALDAAVDPTLPAATLAAIVAAAHAAGLRVTSHTHGLEELDKALDAGVDELAHMLMGIEAIPATTIAEMVASDMTVVPTLAIRGGQELRVAVANLTAFASAGGRIVYGTDLGNAGPAPGIDRREIGHMSAAGMTPHDIIASATVTASRWLKLGATGALEPGRDADIIAVTGDPLKDLRALNHLTMVFRRGRRVV